MTKKLLEQTPLVPLAYKDLHTNVKEWLTPVMYANSLNWLNTVQGTKISTIVYRVGDLRIHGVLVAPQPLEDKKYPVIIFNRGGADGEGVALPVLQHRIYPFVQAGYVVIASHYRGALGSEGVDELGGADVQDVVALFDVIKEVPYADTNNVFMVGFSRGGLMAYAALAQQVPVNAAATMAGVADLFLFEEKRPDAIPLLESMIPDYKNHHDAELTKRSATYWAEKINAPLLLLHGDADTVVSIEESIKLAQQLERYGKAYKFITLPGCNHFFEGNLRKAHQEILAWFEQYKK